MIYKSPPTTDPIKQGDIFVHIPKVEISLKEISVPTDSSQADIVPWEKIIESKSQVAAILPIRSVSGIVVTTDCDNLRSLYITLCEIRDFRDVEKNSKDTTSTKSWTRQIIRQSRHNLKWYYLPADEGVGFEEKMGVDFTSTVSVLREELDSLKQFRVGRLNSIAYDHFRERLGNFFKRYSYDEWYSLTKDEFEEYKKSAPDAEPFDWQKE